MNSKKLINKPGFKYLLYLFLLSWALTLISCASVTYKTYVEDESIEDPEPDYAVTLNPDFQEYTNFMFIGNRLENFGTYFNTFYNAKQNYEEAYEDYELRVLPKYNEQIDSIYKNVPLSQESIDKFTKSIEKASKVTQLHKSTAFMDQAVLLIGKAYYYLGDYLKAERKFNEFLSKLNVSPLYEETTLYYARTQFRLDNAAAAITKLDYLLKNSKDKYIISGAYQTLAEYYISKKDFEAAIKNYRSSIEYSKDNEFKAQMQFLIATIISRTDYGSAAGEFKKVLDYSTSYDLEYYARYNYIKNLILSHKFYNINTLLRKLEVDYKENNTYLGEIKLLSAIHYEQRNNSKSLKEYSDVIKTYPKSGASSDASFSLAKYYEKAGDYLNAYRYYRYSAEENTQGHYYNDANLKINIFRKYYELRSKIAGVVINTEYDSTFLNNVKSDEQRLLEQENPGERKGDEGLGKPGGLKGSSKLLIALTDSLFMNTDSLFMKSDSLSIKRDTLSMKSDSFHMKPDSLIMQVDSVAIRNEEIAKAQFELAELFVYDLNQPDSAEHYLLSSYEISHNDDFKSKVLFALASLYVNQKLTSKADDIYKKIIEEFPLTPAAEESRKQLGLNLTEREYFTDEADSLYSSAEVLLEKKEYRNALDAFNNMVITYPSSRFAGKSYYAMGWIYENALERSDSAYIYYSKLLEKEPNSDYSKRIGSKVMEYLSIILADTTENKTPQNDSSNIQDTSKIKGEEMQKTIELELQKKKDVEQPTDPTQMKKEETDDGSGDPTKK
jgi:tetratricopeptide (TPR) repeat protein